MRRKIIIVMMAMVITGMFFTGCSRKGSAGSSSDVTLSFWKGPNSEREAELWAVIINNFQAENPGIKIDHLITPWDTYLEKYTAAFAGGTPPDVFHLGDVFYPPLAEAGELADLSSYAPANIKEMTGYDIMLYKGKLLGITMNAFASCLFYNTDIFDAAGLKPPETWEELRATAKALTKNGIWGFTPNIYGQYPHITTAFINQGGGNLLNKQMTEMDFGTPEKQRGLQLLHDMVWVDGSIPKINDYSGDEYWNLFINGKSAMLIEQIQEGSNFRNQNPDLNFKITSVPAGPAADYKAARSQYGCVEGLHIAEQSKYKDQAWKFIEYTAVKGEIKSYLKELSFFSGFPDIDAQMYDYSDPDNQVARDAVATMFVYPITSHMGQIIPEFYLMIEEIFYNTKSIAAAYADCQVRVKELLAE